MLKKILLFILSVFLLFSCGASKKLPFENKTIYTYRDCTIVNYKDSIIYVNIPKETIKDYVLSLDTLKLETFVAKSTAFVDTTTNSIKGSLVNKSENVIEKIVYLPSKEKIIYKDTIVIKEVPVEVEKLIEREIVPKWCWWLLGINIIILIIFALKIYIKIKGKIKIV